MTKDILQGKLLQCPNNMIKKDFHDAEGRVYHKFRDSYCRYCVEIDQVKSCIFEPDNPEPVATLRECKNGRKKSKPHEL